MALQGTIVVDFTSTSSSPSDYLFSAEVDKTLNLNSDGEIKGIFEPGDKVFIAVNHSTNIRIDSVVCTDGTIVRESVIRKPDGGLETNPVTRDGSEEMFFTSRKADEPSTVELSKVCTSMTQTYYGRGGSINYDTSPVGVVVATGNVAFTPFIAAMKYKYKATVYKLSLPNVPVSQELDHPVGVVFYISEIT